MPFQSGVLNSAVGVGDPLTEYTDGPLGETYVVFIHGNSYLARNSRTRLIEQSGTSLAAVLNATIASLPTTGGGIRLPGDVYSLDDTVVIGDGTSSVKSTRHGVGLIGAVGRGHGSDELGPRGGATQLVWTGGSAPMIQVSGPISDVVLKGLFL